MAKNITLRRTDEFKEADRIAKATGAKVAFVVALALQHGLPLVESKLAALKPAARKAA